MLNAEDILGRNTQSLSTPGVGIYIPAMHAERFVRLIRSHEIPWPIMTNALWIHGLQEIRRPT